MPETWQEARDSEISVYEQPLTHDSFSSPKSARRERKLTIRKILTTFPLHQRPDFPEPDSANRTNPCHDF